MGDPPLVVSAAVEGMVDGAVVRRSLQDADAPSGPVHVAGGKLQLKHKVGAYNHAAHYGRWVVLVDLNHERDCAPALRNAWLPAPSRFMCFRVAVRAVEAWLLADREKMAQFLGVAVAKVPRRPDSLDDPKRIIVDLARRSRRRDVREDMVPRPKSGRSEGPAYASRIVEFVQGIWRPDVAEANSESLHRCRAALRALVQPSCRAST